MPVFTSNFNSSSVVTAPVQKIAFCLIILLVFSYTSQHIYVKSHAKTQLELFVFRCRVYETHDIPFDIPNLLMRVTLWEFTLPVLLNFS